MPLFSSSYNYVSASLTKTGYNSHIPVELKTILHQDSCCHQTFCLNLCPVHVRLVTHELSLIGIYCCEILSLHAGTVPSILSELQSRFSPDHKQGQHHGLGRKGKGHSTFLHGRPYDGKNTLRFLHGSLFILFYLRALKVIEFSDASAHIWHCWLEYVFHVGDSVGCIVILVVFNLASCVLCTYRAPLKLNDEQPLALLLSWDRRESKLEFGKRTCMCFWKL